MVHEKEDREENEEDVYQGWVMRRRSVSQIPVHHSVWPKTGALSASVLRHKGGLPGHPMDVLSHMEVAPAMRWNSASLGAADEAARTSSFLPLRLLWCSHTGAMWRLIGADPDVCPTVIGTL